MNFTLPAVLEPGTPSDPTLGSLPDEVHNAYDYLPATLAGVAAGIGVICFLFLSTAPLSTVALWLTAFGSLWVARLITWRRFLRALASNDIRSRDDWRRWQLAANAGTLCSGLMWGVSAGVFYPLGSGVQQTGLIIVVYVFCVAVVPVLATQPRTYFAFTLLCLVPMVARITEDGGGENYQLAGILVLIFSLTSVLARSYRQALQRVLELKIRADELLAQLRVEKGAADAARREAEVASRAKTQFFTAASHDLRQPLHAMGLFAEALRQKSHDDEVAQLVNSINSSVDALDGLFCELLDITRIDGGGVEVQPQDFLVGDIFRKLRLHFEPSAFEKGLSLRMRGMRHAVRADPLLVERILRNLVSNAIRYTVDGTVLVSARHHGTQVLLQVWDTGIGIAPDQQQVVFEEFYQVSQRKPATADQRKGLGLGLAIVKRLAALMDAPLTLRSEPGRGTVFTLALPVGKSAPAVQTPQGRQGTRDITLGGRSIVIVEDEPAVRSGLEVLLKGWGATLLSFDSMAAVQDWAAAADPAQAAPDLLIVDYRLENGRNGVEAIAALRRHFERPLPAIVVTGSTMTSHEQEAQEHDFHLLIKPVVPNKLRAMISFKLGVKPA